MRVTSRLYLWLGSALTACLAVGFLLGNAVPSGYGEQEIAQLLFSDLAFSSIGATQ